MSIADQNGFFSFTNRPWLIFVLISIVLLVVFPFIPSYYVHIIVLISLSAYLAQCWNLLSGFTGQFSFGHAVFYGLGAYTSAILFTNYGITPWIGIIAGGIIAMALGLSIGYLCFRFSVKGTYLALVTLGFAELVRHVFINWDFVGGAQGIMIPLTPSLLNFQFTERLPYLYIIFFMLIGIMALTYKIRRSFLGSYMISIKENDIAAESLGVNTMRYKLVAFAISAFFTAMGGAFYAQYIGFAKPEIMFSLTRNIEILLPATLGGFGTVLGPLVGALVVTPIREFARSIFTGGVDLVLFGVILIILMVYEPKGIVGFLKGE